MAMFSIIAMRVAYQVLCLIEIAFIAKICNAVENEKLTRG